MEGLRTLLDGLGIALSLTILGSHTLMPWRLAQAPAPLKRRWSLVALPLLLGVVLVALLRVGTRPDALIELSMNAPLPSSAATQIAFLVLFALGATDLLLVFGWRGLEPPGWKIAGIMGVLALAGTSFVAELVRQGATHENVLIPAIGAALCRTLVGLGAAEALHDRRWGWSWGAGLALLLYPLFMAAELRESLVSSGDLPTLLAAIGLLGSSGLLPQRYRRAAIVAGVLLAGMFLARVELLSRPLEIPVDLQRIG